MATYVSVSQEIQVVDGGQTTIDLSHAISNYEVDYVLHVPLHLPPGASVVFDVASSPLLSGWTAIAGFAGEIKSPAYGELSNLATGAEPVQVGPGPFNMGRAEGAYLKLENTGAMIIEGVIVLFGRK